MQLGCRQIFISAISTEDKMVSRQKKSRVPLNLLRDFETMGTHDQSSTKENNDNSTVHPRKMDNLNPVLNQVARPLSLQLLNKSDNDMDESCFGIYVMISKSVSYSSSASYK